MAKFNFDSFYELYQKDPDGTKLTLVSEAASCILYNIQINRITISELCNDELPPCEICDLMGWPSLMDSGVFEQCAEIAIQMALAISGYKYGHKEVDCYEYSHKELVTNK